MCTCFHCRTQLRIGRFEANFFEFLWICEVLIFLGELRLEVKRFVRRVLIDGSAACRRNPPKSLMDRCGVVTH